LWHLASDESSYVFVRESEEERVVVAFNNADQQRELRIPLATRQCKERLPSSFCSAKPEQELAKGEIRIAMPAQSLTIFSLN